MHYYVDFFGVENFADRLLVFKVALVEFYAFPERGPVAVHEIVEHNRPVAGFD